MLAFLFLSQLQFNFTTGTAITVDSSTESLRLINVPTEIILCLVRGDKRFFVACLFQWVGCRRCSYFVM